jgi:hypothetical protein
MKLKRVIASVIIYTLVLSILGGAIVLAPNPNPGNPLLPLDVLITNTDPIKVTIDGTVSIDNSETVNVEVPDGVEVTNTVTVDGTVAIDDSDPVDVEVVGGVQVLNTVPIPVVASGWLHTTQHGHEYYSSFDAGANYDFIYINAEGYREVTVVLESTQDNVLFGIGWTVDSVFRWEEAFTYGAEKPNAKITPGGGTTSAIFKTYPVKGELLEIAYYADAGVLSSGEGVTIAYYLTT